MNYLFRPNYDNRLEYYENPFRNKNKLHGKNSGFVDSGFVKTCDELELGL